MVVIIEEVIIIIPKHYGDGAKLRACWSNLTQSLPALVKNVHRKG